MSDIFSKDKRSSIMKAVKSSGNKSTEQKLIKIFKELGIKGWRRKYKLIGNPDFVFPKKKIALFTDGCFWHGHNCRNTKPKDNKEYWEEKIGRNVNRDREVTTKLTAKGWTVIRIWECEIRSEMLKQKLEVLSY